MNKKYLKKFSKKNIIKHFGLGNNTNKFLQQRLGLNNNLYFTKIKKKKNFDLQSNIKKISFLNRKLKRKIKSRLNFLIKIKNFKGIHHKKKLSIRGLNKRRNKKTKKIINNKI